MSKPISFGKIDVNLVSTMEEAQGMSEADKPFRIVILGDFSGCNNRGILETGAGLAGRRPVAVDRDNIDDVMKKLGVEIHLSLAGEESPPVTLRFSELDDFHPDRIYESVEVFQTLKKTRDNLNDPRTFASAAKEVRNWIRTETTAKSDIPQAEQKISTPEISAPSAGGLLDQIIEESQGISPEPESTLSSAESQWRAFLRKIVQPYLAPETEQEQDELVTAVDAAVGNLMREILHHPDFQAIEAAWRGVYFLVSRLETDADLKLYLLDISKAELGADLGEREDLRSTTTYKLLVEQTVNTPGAEPWAVWAGNYIFDQAREDTELLGRMARIAKLAGAPFIASAGSLILGCRSLIETPDPDDWREQADKQTSQSWQTLRKLPEASYIGLALPRFLLRLPYGTETDPIESFEFEEMSAIPEHDCYLWGNPCFACVHLLATAFSLYGWNLRPGVIQDIEGLPLHIYQEQGEAKVKPCAEVVLTEHAAEIMLDMGLMPLLSFKNRDVIRPARFQSLADPVTPLSGRWNSDVG